MKQFLLKSLLFITAAMTPLIAIPSLADDTPIKRSKGWFSLFGDYASGQKKWGINGLGAFYETSKSVLYVQGTYQETKRKPVSENAANIGFGYRRLSGNTVFGANMFFFDMSTLKRDFDIKAHYQHSVGLEIKRESFEITSNLYIPRAPENLKNGWDVTAKKTLFLKPNISIGGGKYRLNSFMKDRRAVVTGNKVFVEFKPNSILTISAQHNRPKQGKVTNSVSMEVKFGLNRPWRQQWKQFADRQDTVWRTRYDAAARW